MNGLPGSTIIPVALISTAFTASGAESLPINRPDPRRPRRSSVLVYDTKQTPSVKMPGSASTSIPASLRGDLDESRNQLTGPTGRLEKGESKRASKENKRSQYALTLHPAFLSSKDHGMAPPY